MVQQANGDDEPKHIICPNATSKAEHQKESLSAAPSTGRAAGKVGQNKRDDGDRPGPTTVKEKSTVRSLFRSSLPQENPDARLRSSKKNTRISGDAAAMSVRTWLSTAAGRYFKFVVRRSSIPLHKTDKVHSRREASNIQLSSST
ncbi:hypothetical protein V5O48_013260 [Marasmius crinis-equi]|uniref:Uncharacterized protein n=1 Tax=Marasmius crinis-equi TaxID=585013 RepID=A0ABR3F0K1_9AGAR